MNKMVDKIKADEEVEKYIDKIKEIERDGVIKTYMIEHASDKMIGFLGEYWKLEVEIVTCDNETKWKHFFVKAISKSNIAKANVMKELNLFEKELNFYSVIKKKIGKNGIKPWSANLVTSTNDAMIFEDLNNINYIIRNKFKVFDVQHTLLALNTLARFHASSLIYEEKRSKELQRPYLLKDEYPLDKGLYKTSNIWFVQCTKGALEVIKTHSKYSNSPDVLKQIESKWSGVWNKSLDINDKSNKYEYRNVVCHRDLWTNNIMFRYETVNNTLLPNDCILVDFATVSYQPPASDVMFLLYCTLNPVFREEKMDYFLDYYYKELQNILYNSDVIITNIIPFNDFLMSCEEQRLWGIVASACLVPQFWIDDELSKQIFSNKEKFENASNDKATFIKTMINGNNDYKNKVIPIFEEIVDRYCLDS